MQIRENDSQNNIGNVRGNTVGNLSEKAGLRPLLQDLINVQNLLKAYDENSPDVDDPSNLVQFGTSGHRGSSYAHSFNQKHIAAITQAICDYRKSQKIDGPLFIGFDTHALSAPAFETAIEVLAANGVQTMIDHQNDFTPTPVISHAILTYNRGRKTGMSDGIVITPSHNPPSEGGFKYNPPHGGPAEKEITDVIQNNANSYLRAKMRGVAHLAFAEAKKASCIQAFDYKTAYIADLKNVIDFDVIRNSSLRAGVDPLGGAGVHYWGAISDTYKINLQVLNPNVDPTFRFMTQDWDGKIRMDPSSPFVMKSLIEKRADFDVAFACDTDHDRHGIVTQSSGLMAANDYLATSIWYLFTHRTAWKKNLKIGKTLVSSQMIDRVGQSINRAIYEVPVGFKWFVDGLLDETLGFAGEESAGATFLRKDGRVWTTDKDGLIPGLLSLEMTAKLGRDPGSIYRDLTSQLGHPFYSRIEGKATVAEKKKISNCPIDQIKATELGGDPIDRILTRAPGNNASIGGIKFETKNGWIAVRPSGTEDIYKIYGESFIDPSHLDRLLQDGQTIISDMTREA